MVDPTYYYNYDNKEVYTLYAKAVAATNDDDRDKLLAEAARKVSEDAPADWLFNYRVTTANAKGVTGFPDQPQPDPVAAVQRRLHQVTAEIAAYPGTGDSGSRGRGL